MYDASNIPSSDAFEALVFLILRQEQPNARLERLRPPDGGIDILARTEDAVVAYQCKHYPRPTIQHVKAEVTSSLGQAIKSRFATGWNRIEFCFSGDLTLPQRNAVAEIALKFGLAQEEWGLRTGTQFYAAIMKHPELWDYVVSTPSLRIDRHSPAPLVQDHRITKILRSLQPVGNTLYLSDVFGEFGIGALDNLWDWYHVATQFYDASKDALRTISIDSEIVDFWLSPQGDEYRNMNHRVVSRGVKLTRLYVFDFSIYEPGSLALNTFLHYCALQEKEGLSCRIIPTDVFSGELSFDCTWFAVQDRDNVVFYSNRNRKVNFSWDKAVVQESIDAFDELYNNREARSPIELYSKFQAR